MTEPKLEENTSLHPLEVAAASAALLPNGSMPDSVGPHEAFQGKTETEVAQWATSVRAAFGKEREQFNFAICDALATGGLIPTTASVLRVGKWGHHTSVASDVSAWLSQLTQRFVELQAGVPLPARRLANDLIEKLFSLSRDEAEQSVQLRLAPLEERIIGLSKALEEEQIKVDDLKARYRVSTAQCEQLSTQLVDTRAAAEQQQTTALENAGTLQLTIDRLSAVLIDQKEAAQVAAQAGAKEKDNLQRTLLEAQVSAAQKLQQTYSEHDGERRRLLLQLNEERTAERRAVTALRNEITVVSAKLEKQRIDYDDTNIALARTNATLDGTKASWDNQKAQWALESARLLSPEVRHQSLLEMVMLHRQLGLMISRQKNVDVVATLVEQLRMTTSMANQIARHIPQVNDNFNSTKNVR